MNEREQLKKDTLRLIRRLYKMVEENNDCPLEGINAALKVMYGNTKMNKTEAAGYLGISVSMFDKRMAAGKLPKGHKEANETLHWTAAELDAYTGKQSS